MNPNLHQTFTWMAERVLNDIPANLWDTRGREAFNWELSRWAEKNSDVPESERPSMEDKNEIWKNTILFHKTNDTSQWRQYVKNNGALAEGESDSPESKGGEKSQPFMISGEMSGGTIVLDTIYGRIDTSADNILSFAAFQRDVLRSTGEVYPKQYRKGHENNVAAWMKLVKRRSREDDEASTRWQLERLIDRFLSDYATDELTFESTIKNGKRAVLKRDEFIFTKDTLFAWLKTHDRERRWQRGEVLFALKEIYGSGFNPDKRCFKRRCYAIASDRLQALNDSGGGEDDDAPQENPGIAGTGDSPSEHLRDELQQGDGGGTEGSIAPHAAGPFGT